MQQHLLNQALSLAVLQCNIPAVELLLSWGADPRVVMAPKDATETEENELLKPEYQTDEFSMYIFKIKECERCDVHDWTNCPCAHPGEKARRRDPRVYKYAAVACPEFRKGVCKRGDACPYAHGVFELWMHEDRFRTQLCREGTACTRPVCFFAHSIDQLRTPPSAKANDALASPPCSPPLVDSPPLPPAGGSCKSSLLGSSIDLASTAPSLSASIDGLSDTSYEWLPPAGACCGGHKSSLLSEALLHKHTTAPAAALFAPSPLCNLQSLLMQHH